MKFISYTFSVVFYSAFGFHAICSVLMLSLNLEKREACNVFQDMFNYIKENKFGKTVGNMFCIVVVGGT